MVKPNRSSCCRAGNADGHDHGTLPTPADWEFCRLGTRLH